MQKPAISIGQLYCQPSFSSHDSAAKIISGGYEDMKKLFSEMENICREHGVDFGVTVEGKEEEKPDFILPYI